MGATLGATFETRREAELMAERLMQEHGLKCTDVIIVAAGENNSAGEEQTGPGSQAGAPSPEDHAA